MAASTGQRHRWTNERFDAEITHVTRLGDVTGRHVPVLVRGVECGHEWVGTPGNLSNGSGCFTCNKGERWTNERFDREFPHLTRIGNVTGAVDLVRVLGECGHEWGAYPADLFMGFGEGRGEGIGCSACSKGEYWTNERFDREIKHVTRLGEVVNSKTPLLVRGGCGHE